MALNCILVHSKVLDKKQADQATAHNHRQYEVANADQEAPHPNVEYINTAQRDYWELATERIAEAGITIRRKDQIRIEEILLTASPEFFKRDENGRAEDYSEHKWVKDTMTFLIEKYGAKNVIGFTLHQDEKTPHIHAMVVPITPDGRLSARDVFNPKSLVQNQDDYAAAMKDHGLVRGVKHSQAKHQPMQKMYGQQGQTAAELGAQLGPASSYQDVQVKRPGGKDLFNLGEWEAKTTAQVNEQARRQVEEANERAEKARNLALESAAAKEQVRVLQKQLSTSEGLKDKFRGTVSTAAKRLAGGEEAPKFVKWGSDLLDKAVQDVKAGRAALVKLSTQADQANRKGDTDLGGEINFKQIPVQQAKNKVLEEDLGRFAGGRSRLAELDAQQAEQAKVAAEKARLDHLAQLAAQAKEQADRDKDALMKELIAQGDRERAQQSEALRVVKHELSLMDQAFSIYRWKVGPEELTACLIVPKEKVEQVEKALRVDGKSWAAHLGVQGEPHRTDGQQTVYVRYEASFAHQVGEYLDKVRAGGGQVYEHAGSQARREQLQAQPQQKTQEREQGPALTTDRERD
jgi:hypothetical protein